MGAQEKSLANTNSMQRVKVYRLNDDGKWDDQGTGHVSVDYMERSEELSIFVIDEEDNETLLSHQIVSDDIYRKQEDTIISWRDQGFSTELALSFQESTGCSYIWDQICNGQRNLHFNTLNNETFHNVNNELRDLPAVELSTLPLILKTVVDSGIADQMRLTELILTDQHFLRKLMNLFHVCEDLENIDGLHMIFKIVRGIILLNSQQIYEKLFGDDMMMDVIGSLEYDPEVPKIQHHRSFLKEHVVFKEAIPIKDPIVLSKIHQTYRVGYLKDVILPRVFDDAIITNLNSIIHANNAIVVSLLKDDNTFIQELFVKLRSPTTSAESKKNLVYFLHEFCSVSKSLQVVQHHRLFRDLVNEGIFDMISDALRSQDKRLVLTGTDILILFMNQDPNLLRSYITREEGLPLFGLLVQGMITDFGEDMNCQFLEIIRSLLDSYTLLSGLQRDAMVEIFYEKHLNQVIDVITSSCPSESTQSFHRSAGSGGNSKKQHGAKPEILSNICELLCFCVIHYPYRIKCNFLLNNVIDKVLLLTRRREKYLAVAAIRFFRTILSQHDDHLINYIVKNNLLKPIVEVFVGNGDRYNLLNSVVLELFEYIRKENMKALLRYLVDSFWDQLVKFENLATIQLLKLKYEQSLENAWTKANVEMDTRKQVDERALTKEEEDYFNGESDEEDTASACTSQSQKVNECVLTKEDEDYFNGESDEEDTTSACTPQSQKVQSQPVSLNGEASQPPTRPRSGLVDYEDDDDDDEGYRPPPRERPEISNGDDELVKSLQLKRKVISKQEPEIKKKQRLGRNLKSRDNVFAALCSTLSQAVLPGGKKAVSTMQIISCTADGTRNPEEEKHGEKESAPFRCVTTDYSGLSREGNPKDKEPAASRSCSDCAQNASENNQLGGEDCSLLPSKSSPEMAVNGS